MFTLKPDHDLFTNAGLEFPRAESVEIHIGANPACSRHLKGTGVPCVLYPRLADGSIDGTAAHAGFVVEFDLDELAEAGADEDECWLACGANEGTHADHKNSNEVVCLECLLAGEPGAWYEGQDIEDRVRDIDNERYRRVYAAMPDGY
jgi:hypothetical protein